MAERLRPCPVSDLDCLAEAVKEALDKASSKKDVLLQVQTAQGGTDFKLLKVGVEK